MNATDIEIATMMASKSVCKVSEAFCSNSLLKTSSINSSGDSWTLPKGRERGGVMTRDGTFKMPKVPRGPSDVLVG